MGVFCGVLGAASENRVFFALGVLERSEPVNSESWVRSIISSGSFDLLSALLEALDFCVELSEISGLVGLFGLFLGGFGGLSSVEDLVGVLAEVLPLGVFEGVFVGVLVGVLAGVFVGEDLLDLGGVLVRVLAFLLLLLAFEV